ncbi:MAG: recombination protein RecR [Phycisphaerae bacterium]|nr:recombination protein RecR [Phycisphaerae bacterium]MBM90606.1 recombination protein RecR [Phycisphaerae bacterium]HCT45731.1 recombination protein RecR [Phycisphaerales bacterium]
MSREERRQNGSSGKGASAYPAPVRELIERFAELPGIGVRSAERLAFHVLKSDEPSAMALAQAIAAVKKSVRHCNQCFNLSDSDVCSICADGSRDRSRVLVVEQPKDLIALEQTGMYRGLYHVLMGRLSALDGVGPEDLTIGALLDRVRSSGGEIEEVVLGLNPTVEGDGTGLYLAQALGELGVPVSRLARGLPSGGSLEYANKAVLADAILGRQSMGGGG